ncbi:MAG: malto-oligosyltrehalose trehalohydrolase [Frankiales bacterium]|nr:malto-oligosyltrehalose trehalohydrolase [Frankiales bacterium]
MSVPPPLQVWAPRATRLRALPDGREPDELRPLPERPGWYGGGEAWWRPGAEYLLEVDGSTVPDPRARFLPHGVHGPARVVDVAALPWTDDGWRGRDLADGAVVYELHVGTATPDGTLDAAIDLLDDLAALGITHVELLPLAAFEGPWGWGYDGVALDAVHAHYGGPEALARFVDAAHARGLAVLLDVVHNHLGPSGNYWSAFGPFFTDAHTTPWGPAVNLDDRGSDDVRGILVDSACGWLRDYHLDGLRLDAVHELRDHRALTFLEELGEAVARLSVELGRPLTLVAETDRNDVRTVAPPSRGGVGMTAQWDDDVHHALHWLLTGETSGYYADFGSCASVAHTLERGFLHDGRWSTFRGRSHGRPVDWSATDPWRLVVALQTHDQVGNRAAGERLVRLAGIDRAAIGAALLLTLPYTPMLFMGEEWGATTPWCFFSSFTDPELARAVTEGRRGEFSDHGWDPAAVPDPQDPATRDRSVLAREERLTGEHARLLDWYRALIALRSAPDGPGSASASAHDASSQRRGAPDGLHCGWSEDAEGRARWFSVRRRGWATVANLSDEPVTVPAEGARSIELDWPAGTASVGPDGLALPPLGVAVLRR